MGTGLQTTNPNPRSVVIRILEGATGTNSAPTSYAAAGVDVGAALDSVYSPKACPSSCLIHVYNTAGSGVVTATIRLWGGEPVAAKYSPVGIGIGALAGVLNGGAAHDEVSADYIGRYETFVWPGALRKLYAEVVAIGGSSTAVNVDLIFQWGIS